MLGRVLAGLRDLILIMGILVFTSYGAYRFWSGPDQSQAAPSFKHITSVCVPK